MKFFRHLGAALKFNGLEKAERRITVYSEGKTYWPHLQALLEEMLRTTDIPICYVSSSDADPGLSIEHKNLKTFQIGDGFVRNYFFENIDTDIMVMTMPDIDQYQVKRSKFPVHYVYVQHSLMSLHTIYRDGAFDAYDTIFCGGPHHVREAKAIIAAKGLADKSLVEHGYARLDSIVNGRKPFSANEIPHILIAPSWGEGGLIELQGEAVVNALLSAGYRVTLRPHPQTAKFSTSVIRDIQKTHNSNEKFTLEQNVAGKESLEASDVMISDWSGAALDYAFGLGKPVVFVETPQKINNPEYKTIDITPIEVSIREQVGTICPLSDISNIAQYVASALEQHKGPDQVSLDIIASKNVFNIGTSEKHGAAYICGLLD